MRIIISSFKSDCVLLPILNKKPNQSSGTSKNKIKNVTGSMRNMRWLTFQEFLIKPKTFQPSRESADRRFNKPVLDESSLEMMQNN